MSVCLSVTLYLTSQMFVRLTNGTAYLTGNEVRNFEVFCSVAKLERFHYFTANASSHHFIVTENAHAHFIDGLPRPDSARFEHGGGSRSNTKGEYVVLVCPKHYQPT